ncbi:hypothetical protein J6590_056100 [Homalodisca vitripennis]|nr:hypothetical protein J6590_056100 [Homalodisca vitripennis]
MKTFPPTRKSLRPFHQSRDTVSGSSHNPALCDTPDWCGGSLLSFSETASGLRPLLIDLEGHTNVLPHKFSAGVFEHH